MRPIGWIIVSYRLVQCLSQAETPTSISTSILLAKVVLNNEEADNNLILKLDLILEKRLQKRFYHNF